MMPFCGARLQFAPEILTHIPSLGKGFTATSPAGDGTSLDKIKKKKKEV